jgi:outer membrane protein OmpA-like peptidoglycan-associated protein
MMGDDRERLRPPSTFTPAPKRDSKPMAAPAKDDARRTGGPSHDIAAVGIHPAAAPGTSTKTLDRFALDSAALTADHRKALDDIAADVAARLAADPGARAEITISGHTDTSGDEAHNQGLGLDRAESAKTGLEAALGRKRADASRAGPIATESFGETRLAKETNDDVKEPSNRRVEITVRVVSPPPVIVVPGPGLVGGGEKRKPPILDLPKDYRPKEPTWWERTEDERRRIDEYDRTHPKRSRSLTDIITEGVTDALEPVIKKLPKWLQPKARDAIRAGIEGGTEAACDAAVDASGVSGDEAKAMKAACKAALKTKPEGSR